MLHLRAIQSTSKNERAGTYRRYAEELRETSHILQCPEAREVLLKIAGDYERMAASFARTDDTYTDLTFH